ncbi:GNAT family N-acetyltransferase [Methylopila henanensis]|uniref:GNAT family N-acetyltransferase n=1 Tax=Methylopila henanensis TaxID=873516 RepID=A0ABW4K8T8_9HYPH
MSEFLIREANDGDGPELAGLARRVFEEHGGAAFDPARHPELDQPASAYAGRGGRLWVVARGDTLVGGLAVARRFRAGEFEIALLYLDRDVRGQGLAAALLAGATAFATASGGERLTSWLDARFESGARFYERQGFLRLPGVRARHDAEDTLQHAYARDVAQVA